ncbi:MAG: MBOAT family protein [Bacteroidales bacterium]|nr:MBOAT family protein [Bacteroidales bacterium]MBN2818404.1 MBOAT family protein [Bacteroidales bacterium]
MKDFFQHIFIYNQDSPLIFTRFFFWGFFAVVLAGFSIIHKHKALRNAYLFLVSLFFYYKTGGLFFFILIFSTVTDYGIGHAIYSSSSQIRKKLWLALSLTVNLGVLLFFKYDYFLTDTFNKIFGTNLEVVTHAAKWSNEMFGTHFDLGKILPPVGISFFTFQTISYSIDVYRGLVKPVKSLLDFGFYVSFFPQLVAGPIVRAADFIPQLYNKYSLTSREFGYAFYLILKGLTKKMFIGDYLAVNLIDRVFSNPASYSGFENLSALYSYSLQVYCDFSGYTDIAIGVALLMGFYLPKNFNSPYKAKSVSDFWRRWHMSLSSWLKDYLYIPMGGNRGASTFTYISLIVILGFVILLSGKLILIPIIVFLAGVIWLLTRFFPPIKLTVSTNINIMMTMLLGGLWHGSSWMFVIWGGLNGLGVLIYKYWKKISPYQNKNVWYVNTWRIFLTFSFITFTRIWFRGESMQGTAELLGQITRNFGWGHVYEMIVSYWKPLAMLAFGLTMHWLPDKVKCAYRDWFILRPLYQKIGIASGIVFVIYQSVSSELTPFIYFQF